MGNYGITALSGFSGSLDRQDKREWTEESQGQQRKQWDRADEEWKAGATGRENQKTKDLYEKVKLAHEKTMQELWPALQIIDNDNGDKDEHGKAMAKVLSGVNGKEIEYAPADFSGRGQEQSGFQFKSKDGKIYSFEDFQHARDNIGKTVQDPVAFFNARFESLNEEGIYQDAKGNMVTMKRGEAERKGFRSYKELTAEKTLLALGKKDRPNYKAITTANGVSAYNEQNPNDRVFMGPAPVSAADRNVYGTVNTGDGVMAFNKYNPSDTRRIGASPVSASDRAAERNAGIASLGKIAKASKDVLAFKLTPFSQSGEIQSWDSDEPPEQAKNALAVAQRFYTANKGKEATLDPAAKENLRNAEEAIQMYNDMAKTLTDGYYKDKPPARQTALGNGSPTPTPGATNSSKTIDLSKYLKK